MSRTKSQPIYVIKNKMNTTDSFNFDWELTKDLVVPHMKKRLLKGGLSKPLEQSILLFAGIATAAEKPPPPDDNMLRRCRICLKETHGDGQKETKRSIGKVKSQCCN